MVVKFKDPQKINGECHYHLALINANVRSFLSKR